MSSDLTKQLIDELEPVTPLAPSGKRTRNFLALSLICVAAIVLMFSTRPHLLESLAKPKVALETFFILALIVLTSYSSFRSSIPGVEQSKIERYGAYLILGAWGLLLAYYASGELRDFHLHSFFEEKCAYKLLLGAIAPALVVFWMLRSGASTAPKLCSLNAGLAATGVSLFSLQLMCPMDSAMHILVSHLLPGLAVTAGLFLFAKRLIRSPE